MFLTGMKTFRRLQDPYYQGSPAELGFFFLLSIIPMLSLLLQIINRLPPARALFDRVLDSFGSNVLVSGFIGALQSESTGKISLMFLILAVWSASKLEFSMIRMSNYTYQCSGENGFVGFIKARVRAIFTVVMLIFILAGSLMVLVYGGKILAAANEFAGGSVSRYTSFLTSFIRWPLMLVLYWLFIAIHYMMTPNEPLTIKEVLPGSLFASVGILIATIGYNIYFVYFSHLNLVYGSLAAVVALLLWFYILGFVLVIGMIINASWFGRGEDRY